MRLHRILFLVLSPLFFALGPSPLSAAEDLSPRADQTSQEIHSTSARARIDARRTPVVAAVERVKAAVVNIHSERTVHGPANAELFALSPSQNRINGMGTGILIDPRGYIVTNQHVVEDVNVIRIRLCNGTSLNATVVARSPEVDLALLKIDTNQPLSIMPLGTASDLMVGETVLAIGNAYGYEHTVSLGIVSAVKRDVSLNKEVSYKSLIQTDASINPGNSGGPLLNINGDLVGVNVAIRAGAQGIGFAIPVDTMARVVSDMLRTRRRQTAFDGITYRDRIDQTEDGPVRTVVVERTDPGSPAEAAGLQKGDVLTKVGDVVVACSYDVDRGMLDGRVGDHVPVVLKRQGAAKSVDLVLQASEQNRPVSGDLVWRKLGVQLTQISSDQVARINRQLNGGMEVTAVNADGVAGKAGIRRGDILVGLHQWETLTMDNVAFVLQHPDLPSFNPLSFYIVRGGQVRRGWMQQVE